MKHKVIITNDDYEVNQYLTTGWKVISVTAQITPTSEKIYDKGKFCFVLEKEL